MLQNDQVLNDEGRREICEGDGRALGLAGHELGRRRRRGVSPALQSRYFSADSRDKAGAAPVLDGKPLSVSAKLVVMPGVAFELTDNFRTFWSRAGQRPPVAGTVEPRSFFAEG